jgi:hypothetical protein
MRLLRRSRGLVIALAALALTAGAALAGHSALSTPSAASAGLERAAAASGQTVPVEPPDAGPAADENTDEDTDEGTDVGDNAPTADASADHPDNHGKLVSEAAQATTPGTFDNHGLYVKSVATANHGQDAKAQRGASTTKKPTH